MQSNDLYGFQKNTQGRIQLAALEVFVENGFRGTTFAEIARRAKITKPNVSYYYKTVDEILIDLMKRWAQTGQEVTVQTLLNHAGEDSDRLVVRIADALFDWAIRYPLFSALTPVLIQAATSDKKIGEMQRAVMEVGLLRIRDLLSRSKRLAHLKDPDLNRLAQAIHCSMVGSYFYAAVQGIDQRKMKPRTAEIISHFIELEALAQ